MDSLLSCCHVILANAEGGGGGVGWGGWALVLHIEREIEIQSVAITGEALGGAF